MEVAGPLGIPLGLAQRPQTAAHRATLSFTVSQSLLKFMSIVSVILSNCLRPGSGQDRPTFSVLRLQLKKLLESLPAVGHTSKAGAPSSIPG